MEKETSTKTESRYNMNESNFVLLGELQTEAFRFMNVKHDYISCMDRWQSIRLIIQSMFSEPESQSLNLIEVDFVKPLRFNVPCDLSTSKPMYGLSQRQKYIYSVYQTYRLKHLKNYIQTLGELMRKYKISMTDLDKKKRLS